jgi:hypothetical protein
MGRIAYNLDKFQVIAVLPKAQKGIADDHYSSMLTPLSKIAIPFRKDTQRQLIVWLSIITKMNGSLEPIR